MASYEEDIRPLLKPIKSWIVFFVALGLFGLEAVLLPIDPPGWALVVLFLVDVVVASVLVDLLIGGTWLGAKKLVSGGGEAGGDGLRRPSSSWIAPSGAGSAGGQSRSES